jgi:hypothetical protein
MDPVLDGVVDGVMVVVDVEEHDVASNITTANRAINTIPDL